jgi:hypothetical protein
LKPSQPQLPACLVCIAATCQHHAATCLVPACLSHECTCAVVELVPGVPLHCCCHGMVPTSCLLLSFAALQACGSLLRLLWPLAVQQSSLGLGVMRWAKPCRSNCAAPNQDKYRDSQALLSVAASTVPGDSSAEVQRGGVPGRRVGVRALVYAVAGINADSMTTHFETPPATATGLPLHACQQQHLHGSSSPAVRSLGPAGAVFQRHTACAVCLADTQG